MIEVAKLQQQESFEKVISTKSLETKPPGSRPSFSIVKTTRSV